MTGTTGFKSKNRPRDNANRGNRKKSKKDNANEHPSETDSGQTIDPDAV